jgi:ribonuclease HII
MDVSRMPLRDLERRLGDPTRRRVPASLLRTLRHDPRAGARRLAERWLQRRAAFAEDRRRIGVLFALRRRLASSGCRVVAGVDEAGMGPLAGPVVAAAVVLCERPDLPGLDDSKKLTRAVRERLDAEIRDQALAIGLGEVWPEEIERLNVYRAGLEAMRRAVLALPMTPDHVLVDARQVPGIAAPQTALVHGDALDGSIAAASVLAKVRRDGIMRELALRHPGYGFERHKGYGTAEHLEALRRLGPSPVHRRSFAPVSQLSLVGW